MQCGRAVTSGRRVMISMGVGGKIGEGGQRLPRGRASPHQPENTSLPWPCRHRPALTRLGASACRGESTRKLRFRQLASRVVAVVRRLVRCRSAHRNRQHTTAGRGALAIGHQQKDTVVSDGKSTVSPPTGNAELSWVLVPAWMFLSDRAARYVDTECAEHSQWFLDSVPARRPIGLMPVSQTRSARRRAAANRCST